MYHSPKLMTLFVVPSSKLLGFHRNSGLDCVFPPNSTSLLHAVFYKVTYSGISWMKKGVTCQFWPSAFQCFFLALTDLNLKGNSIAEKKTEKNQNLLLFVIVFLPSFQIKR